MVDSQMKKGVLEMCLLHLVAKRETYGYDLLEQAAHAFPDVAESTVYAVLRRLCADGFTETYPGQVSNGPPRKYYRITASGKERLSGLIGDWKRLMGSVQKLGIE